MVNETEATKAKRGLLGMWIDGSVLGRQALELAGGDKEAAIDNTLALHEGGFLDITITEHGGNVTISVRIKEDDGPPRISYGGAPRNRHERRAQKRRR